MTKIYTTWDANETQIYDQQCGDKTETDSDFNKNIGAGFIMDAVGKSLNLKNSVGVFWPAAPNDPDELADTVTEFGIFSGVFSYTSGMSVFMGLQRPFRLTSQRDGSMKITVDSVISTASHEDSNGSVDIGMYDTSMLSLSSGIFEWGGRFSAYDSTKLDIFTPRVIPHDSLTELHGKSVLNLTTNNIMVTKDQWRISLFDGAPQLNIIVYSVGGDPLQSRDAEAAYPKGIIDFASSSKGTVAIDMPSANTFTLSLLNQRGTFSLDGRVIDMRTDGQFKIGYAHDVQRGSFTTDTMIITKER